MSLECAISNFNLVRGGNGMRKVSGGPNFSKLEDVGLEGCGVVKSVGLIRGPKEGPLVSTSENMLVSDPVPHDDSEFAAEDDGLFSEAGEDLREAGHDFPGHNSSNKSIKRHGDGLVKFGNGVPAAIKASHRASNSGMFQASLFVSKSGVEDDGLVKCGDGEVWILMELIVMCLDLIYL
ncbi:hypothetical protein Q3G72_013304 [Acer saccharum]|nr:hypothetical protein Q3G72_013304 [Acer saccharum]